MLSQGSSSPKDDELLSDDIAISSTARLAMMIPVYIPSVICSLFVLYHLIFRRTLRQALHNHVIAILLVINLIVQLTDLPLIMNYYRLGHVWPSSPSLCLIWTLIHEGLFITVTAFFAWATIERHILIFHDRLTSTRQKTIIFHYGPIVLVALYCFCYSMIVIVFPPCENIYDYSQLVCGQSICYYQKDTLAIWDVIVNHLIPAIIIVSASVALLLRAIYQKTRLRQPARWGNYRKMTIQLLSISLLYLIIYIPRLFMEFLHLCCLPEEVGAGFVTYAEFFAFYGNLLLPFVCAGSLPNLKGKLKSLFTCRRQTARTIHPQPETLARPVVHRQ